jgi:hypothetical protein
VNQEIFFFPSAKHSDQIKKGFAIIQGWRLSREFLITFLHRACDTKFETATNLTAMSSSPYAYYVIVLSLDNGNVEVVLNFQTEQTAKIGAEDMRRMWDATHFSVRYGQRRGNHHGHEEEEEAVDAVDVGMC